jgi:putative salt-induced outer membrane protein YdiY
MRLCVLVLAATVASSSTLHAQRATLTLDAGFVNASGNSDFTSFALGEKLAWRRGRMVLSQTANVLYGETDRTTTTESYDAGGRAEYVLTSRIGAFALLTYQRDPFAGVASRWGGGPGVAVALVRAARDTLGIETAITRQRERSIAGARKSFGATRTAANFKHLFGASAFFTQTLVWIANLDTMDDQRLTSETALTAPLSRQIALRVSYLMRHDNLPEPGFERTDRILTTGVQVAF